MTERFDLEKWLFAHDFDAPFVLEKGITLNPRELKGLVTAAENHQRELMYCGHPRACGHFHIDLRGFLSDRVCHCDMPEAQRRICTVCAELSRVSERTKRLSEAATTKPPEPRYIPAADGKELTWLQGWRAGVEAMIAKIRALESE